MELFRREQYLSMKKFYQKPIDNNRNIELDKSFIIGTKGKEKWNI